MWTKYLRLRPIAGYLLLIAGFATAQEPEWYSSNRDYMLLDRSAVEGTVAPETGWYLASLRSDASEERILYEDGIERGRELLDYDVANRVVSRRRSDASGALVFAERYRFRPDGSLRGVIRCGGDGECIEIRYEGISAGEEVLGSDFELRYSYDEAGRPTEEVRREGDEPRAVRRYEYENGRLATVRTVQGDRETLERFENGLTVEITEHRAGRRISRERFEYDDEDRLVLREEQTRRQVTIERYVYPDEGGSIRELVLDGGLVEREIVEPSGTTSVERFSDGELVSRTVLDDGRVTRRETWIDGRLVSVERKPAQEDPPLESAQ